MPVSEMQVYSGNAVAADNAAGGGRPVAADSLIMAELKSPASAAPAKTAPPVPKLPAHSTATAGAPAHKEAFPPFDSSYFASHILWLAICFGFFYLFMARVILPRIGGVIESRHDRIAADLDQAARMKGEADAAVEAYQKGLNDAHIRAKALAAEAAEKAGAKAEAERKAAESALEAKWAAAAADIAAQRERALAEVEHIAADIAADIIQKISGKKADAAAAAQAVTKTAAAGSAG